MKVVIIGGSFAGLTCAQTLHRLSPETEVIIIDENKQGAAIPNGLNWYYQGRIKMLRESLLSENAILNQLPATIYFEHKVVAIEGHLNQVLVEHDGQIQSITYDKLVCAMGATPQSTYIEGADLSGVITIKDYHSSQQAKSILDKAEHLLIVGTGPVGLEACHTYVSLGKQVTLLEAGPHLDFKQTDAGMLPELLEALEASGVSLLTNTRAKRITSQGERLCVQTDHQDFIADAVLLAVNFRPNSQLLQEQVTLNPDQTVLINEAMQTSQANIYAIGDLVAQETPSGQKTYIPLISNAIRTGEQAAYAILGHQRKLPPSVKAIGHEIFGLYRFSIGQTEEEASLYQDVVSLIYQSPISLFDTNLLRLKLVVARSTGLVLGAQVLSKSDVSSLAAQLVTVMSYGHRDDEIAGQDFLVSFGQTDLYYHFHKAVQRILEMRLGLCKSKD